MSTVPFVSNIAHVAPLCASLVRQETDDVMGALDGSIGFTNSWIPAYTSSGCRATQSGTAAPIPGTVSWRTPRSSVSDISTGPPVMVVVRSAESNCTPVTES